MNKHTFTPDTGGVIHNPDTKRVDASGVPVKDQENGDFHGVLTKCWPIEPGRYTFTFAKDAASYARRARGEGFSASVARRLGIGHPFWSVIVERK